jgi:hypothetical protein
MGGLLLFNPHEKYPNHIEITIFLLLKSHGKPALFMVKIQWHPLQVTDSESVSSMEVAGVAMRL